MSEKILGLDISTSVIGVCIIDKQSGKIDKLDALVFKKEKTLWEKADKFFLFVEELKEKNNGTTWNIAVEEALMMFKKGFSSSQTISTLMKFNALISYVSRNTLKTEPVFISAATARKSCGIKITKSTKSAKQQTFEHMSKNDLKDFKWPLTRNGNNVSWSLDATDAYCIAKCFFNTSK